jgi:hypothetical protein
LFFHKIVRKYFLKCLALHSDITFFQKIKWRW